MLSTPSRLYLQMMYLSELAGLEVLGLWIVTCPREQMNYYSGISQFSEQMSCKNENNLP